MSIITLGLGSVPIGLPSYNAEVDANGNVVRTPRWGPSSLLTLGLGRREAQTAHYPYFNTMTMGFYSAPKKEDELYSFQVNQGGVNDNYTSDLKYGRVVRRADHTAIHNARCADVPSINRNLASPRPYLDYGTRFKTDPIACTEDYFVRPLGTSRVASAGDIEYAVMTPDSHSVYNARSVLIIFPEDAVLGPRSIQRLEFFLKRTKENAVNMRVRKDKGRLLIELLNPKTSLKVIRQQIGRFFVEVPLTRSYDPITLQVYSGME